MLFADPLAPEGGSSTSLELATRWPESAGSVAIAVSLCGSTVLSQFAMTFEPKAIDDSHTGALRRLCQAPVWSDQRRRLGEMKAASYAEAL